MGEVQAVKLLSSVHWRVAPASLVKLNDGLELLLGLVGDAVMLAVGAVVSIVQLKLAGVLVLPAAVAVTWNVCEPCVSEL
jgi:hypothetical protein